MQTIADKTLLIRFADSLELLHGFDDTQGFHCAWQANIGTDLPLSRTGEGRMRSRQTDWLNRAGGSDCLRGLDGDGKVGRCGAAGWLKAGAGFLQIVAMGATIMISPEAPDMAALRDGEQAIPGGQGNPVAMTCDWSG